MAKTRARRKRRRPPTDDLDAAVAVRPGGGARKLVRELWSVAAAAMVVLFARSSLADHYVVPTGSMLPTVEIGDRVLVDKQAYGLRAPLTSWKLVEGGEPRPGDVIVFEGPESGEVLLKRVAAVPGDVVAVRGGRLVRDGVLAPIAGRAARQTEELDGRPHRVDLGAGGPDFGPAVVPAERYLVLGDNRGNSHDGRMFGWVPRSAILGRVVAVFSRRGALRWLPL
jgi:signal peptidase I